MEGLILGILRYAFLKIFKSPPRTLTFTLSVSGNLPRLPKVEFLSAECSCSGSCMGVEFRLHSPNVERNDIFFINHVNFLFNFQAIILQHLFFFTVFQVFNPSAETKCLIILNRNCNMSDLIPCKCHQGRCTTLCKWPRDAI